MKSIKFSEKELEFLKQQYIDELANAEEYVIQIKGILKKLNVTVIEDSEEKKSKKIKVKQPKKVNEAAEKAAPKKRGRKPKNPVTDNALSVKPVKKEAPAKKEPQKRGRKPKAVIPAPVSTPAVVAPVAKVKPVKKVIAKPKKKVKAAKPKVEKKPVPTPVTDIAAVTKEL